MNESATDLRDEFRSPRGPARENTGPLFWLHGTESEERLREYVGHVDEGGQGILTIESRPHIDWMREGWWRDVDIVLDECRKRGLKAMIYDDYWWPSQGMGGKYPIPEAFQCRDVKGTVHPSREAPAKAENEVARIVVKEVGVGVFEPAPDGDRTIVYTWFTSNGGYAFPTVNGLDEAAVDWFIANYYQPYYDRYGDFFRDGTIPGFFFDEPEFRSWWGDALAKELEARGDDVGELLTALRFKLADPDAQARAIYRYHDARAEVWGRTMYGRQSDWCRKHGVYSSGHFLEQRDDYYDPLCSGGDVMRQLKYAEVPGVDLICRQFEPCKRDHIGYQICFGQIPKYASSAAHVYNRHGGLNWCEIFGASGQDYPYPGMKWVCDWHHYLGCHYLIPHSFNPKAPFDDDCPPYFYNGGFEPRFPLFRVWADYNNRCALLLSGGEHVCHIAQCVPGVSFHAGRTFRPEMFSFLIQDAQLDSDWMGYDAVEAAAIEKNPRTGRPSLRTEKGVEHYDVLTLPPAEYIPFATLEKALAFAKAGGVVVGYGIRPCKTPTRGKTAEDARAVVDDIFAQPTAFFLEGELDAARLRAAFAENYPGENRPLAVRHFDFAGLSEEDAHMLAVKHCERDGDVFVFIANQDIGRRRDLAVRAQWPVERAELWDPMQGTVERPNVEDGLVKLALEPSQAMFLVWRSDATGAAPPRVEMPEGTVVPASAGETVTPMAVGEVQDGPVTRSPYAESVATALAFTLPPLEPGDRVYFACDGTEGENSAAVTVNGAFAGGFIGAPFRLDVTRAVREGANRLVTRPFRIRNPRIVLAKVRGVRRI